MKQLRSRFFEATCWTGETIEADPQEFDIVFLFAGWETRVTEIARYAFHGQRAVLVKWKEAATPQSLWATDIQERLKLLCDEKCHDTKVMDFSMLCDLEKNALKIHEEIASLHERLGRPLRILYDISNCPEYFAMNILGFTLRAGIASQWTFFYSEAEYPQGDGVASFTQGRWDSLPVNYLRAPVDPEGQNCLIMGLGFEGEKALQFFNRYQPDRLYLLVPKPGFSEQYTNRTAEENMHIINKVTDDNPNYKIIYAPAGDSLSAYEEIYNAMTELDNENIICNFFLIPTGPKPHAIAMALAAFDHPRATVLYRKPEQFIVKNSLNNGKSWIFHVLDHSIPAFLEAHEPAATTISPSPDPPT